jgi:hypothetical protein
LRRASMKDKTVAILESRVRDHIASLVRKYGGTPFSAPALAEIPDVDPAHIQELIRDWNSTPPDIFIFQTGVGTRALFDKLFYGMLFKGPGIISVDLKPCLLAVPQFHSGNVRVKPIFVGFRHRDHSLGQGGCAGVKILRQFMESLWIVFLITCQLIACQQFFRHRQERMQKRKAVEKITIRWVSIVRL